MSFLACTNYKPMKLVIFKIHPRPCVMEDNPQKKAALILYL